MSTTKLKGATVNLCGTPLAVGKDAPTVTLVNKDLAERKVGGKTGKVQLFVVVPSLDTPVCATETRKFNEKAAALKDVEITIVSMDLPFAGKRFCAAEGIENVTFASDFRNKDFAKAYGVLLADGPLAGVTCRAIFVVGKDGKIAYQEVTKDITDEPDYAKCLECAQKLAK